MKNNNKILIIVGIVLFLAVLFLIFFSDIFTVKSISYDEFITKIETGEITAIKVDGYAVKSTATKDSTKNYSTVILDRGVFQKTIDDWRKDGTITLTTNIADPKDGEIWSTVLTFALFVVLIVAFFLITRQMQTGGSKISNFGRIKARLSVNEKMRFTDIAGADEEKEELSEIVEFLKAPKKFTSLGARIPKGVLLIGPPGTGKTMFAKAIAGEANVPFYSISGSDFVEMYVGVGASRVRDLFEVAKKSMPCIVFIDEIDAVGRQRGTGLGGGHDEREQTLNQLLVIMDGFETHSEIIVLAATNRADVLDPALLRPGRFDRQIVINLPDVKGREAILRVHSRNKPIGEDVNFKSIARVTSGFSGADLENLLNESAILAARGGRKKISYKDVNEGINKVLMGPQKKSRLVTETDKRITAYHEAGHAIVAYSLPNCDPVHEVSIIPRGMAAGYTVTLPDNDNNHETKSNLLDDIAMMLGGRVAEEIVIKDVSVGAISDLQRISKLARLMVAEWGMSDKIGNVSFKGGQEVFIGRDYSAHNVYSEETAKIIDEEVKTIIDKQHGRATEILKEKRLILDNLARLLIEKETIIAEEFKMLMNGASVEDVARFMDEREKKMNGSGVVPN